MGTVAIPAMRILPNDMSEVQQRLQTMKEGDTVEFMTERGVPVSVSRTDKGLETNIKVKVTCPLARAIAGIIFFAVALGTVASLLDGEGEVITIAGVVFAKSFVEALVEKIASGLAFETLVFTLAQHVC